MYGNSLPLLSLWHQFEGLVEALYDAISWGMVGVVLMTLIWSAVGSQFPSAVVM